MSSACSRTYSIFTARCDSRWMRPLVHVNLAIACLLAFGQTIFAQSTFGTVLGTVKDPSGSLIPMATVTLTNTGTNGEHSTITNSNGAYEFVNVEIGNYKLSVDAIG